MRRRTQRINDLLREEISTILHMEARDPRLETMLSITEVEMSDDMRHAKVFVSVYGEDEERAGAFKALEAARSFVQRLLRQRIPELRIIPTIEFHRDDSIERGAHLTGVLNELARERGEQP